MKSLKEVYLEAKSDVNYEDLLRYIPTGSKVVTQLSEKYLTLTILNPTSAPPLTTDNVSNIEKRMKRDIDSFIKDIEGEINISKIRKDPYIHMQGKEGNIIFSYRFTFEVKNKTEGKKLKLLDEALDFYKKATYYKF